MIIIDAPPGCSCPLVESIYGCDYCIIVTEPTPSGLHDIKAMSEILDEMDIPFGVILNKSENFDKLENKKIIKKEIIGNPGHRKGYLPMYFRDININCVIAGGAVRAIVSLAGIKDILTKSIGSNNPYSMANATMEALKQLKSPEEVAEMRGKKVEEILS